MFPTGTAGAALFLLRISVAATLLANGIGHWAPATPFWILLVFAVSAMFLALGLLTPYFAAMSGFMQLGIFITAGSVGQAHVWTSMLDSFVLAVLGPGAYSIDARLFGRRLLTVPRR